MPRRTAVETAPRRQRGRAAAPPVHFLWVLQRRAAERKRKGTKGCGGGDEILACPRFLLPSPLSLSSLSPPLLGALPPPRLARLRFARPAHPRPAAIPAWRRQASVKDMSPFLRLPPLAYIVPTTGRRSRCRRRPRRTRASPRHTSAARLTERHPAEGGRGFFLASKGEKNNNKAQKSILQTQKRRHAAAAPLSRAFLHAGPSRASCIHSTCACSSSRPRAAGAAEKRRCRGRFRRCPRHVILPVLTILPFFPSLRRCRPPPPSSSFAPTAPARATACGSSSSDRRRCVRFRGSRGGGGFKLTFPRQPSTLLRSPRTFLCFALRVPCSPPRPRCLWQDPRSPLSTRTPPWTPAALSCRRRCTQ